MIALHRCDLFSDHGWLCASYREETQFSTGAWSWITCMKQTLLHRDTKSPSLSQTQGYSYTDCRTKSSPAISKPKVGGSSKPWELSNRKLEPLVCLLGFEPLSSFSLALSFDPSIRKGKAEILMSWNCFYVLRQLCNTPNTGRDQGVQKRCLG